MLSHSCLFVDKMECGFELGHWSMFQRVQKRVSGTDMKVCTDENTGFCMCVIPDIGFFMYKKRGHNGRFTYIRYANRTCKGTFSTTYGH